jgi:predicted hydrocarbon binding protein
MKELEMKDGRITLLGRSAIFLPAEMLIRMHELISVENGTAAADRLLAEIGREQTSRGSGKYSKRTIDFAKIVKRVPHTGDAGLEMGREMLKFIGVGEIEIESIDEKAGKIILTTKYSPYAFEHLKTRGKSDRPVCHHLKGLLSGVLEGTGRTGYEAKEIACLSTGKSDRCIFEFRRKSVNPPGS